VCRAVLFDKLDSQNAWARSSRVVSRRDDPSGNWAYLVLVPSELFPVLEYVAVCLGLVGL